MHARRLACFFLGLWLAGSLFMAWVATQNFRQVDRLLSREDPTATLRLKPLGADARAILRYQASEQNRWYFSKWETIQLIYGAFFFFVMLFGSRENKFVLLGVLLLVVLVALQKFLLTPEVTALGRMIDFVPPEQETPERTRFWILHTAYTGVELGKWGVALFLTAQMVFSRKRSGRSRDSRRELNSIDKPDYRGVNR
jgi:hypothetical protein